MGNGCLLLTQNQSLYAGRLSGFDCVCGTFRHDTTDDAFYETQPDVLFAEAIRAPLAEPRGRVVQGYASRRIARPGIFLSFVEACWLIDRWRLDYHHHCIHNSLVDKRWLINASRRNQRPHNRPQAKQKPRRSGRATGLYQVEYDSGRKSDKETEDCFWEVLPNEPIVEPFSGCKYHLRCNKFPRWLQFVNVQIAKESGISSRNIELAKRRYQLRLSDHFFSHSTWCKDRGCHQSKSLN